jgi:solute carrier family 6 GABA transporter-like protein 1
MVKASRAVVVTVLTIFSFLLCLPYCTEFGYYLLDGVDRWINNIALIFVVWTEVTSATTVYRWRDIADQTGIVAFSLYNFGFFGGQFFGILLAHGIRSPGIGAGAGIGFYVAFTLIATTIAQTPQTRAPSFWNSNHFLCRFWFLAFYSGNQIRRDLNVIVGQGKNWKIPAFLPFLLRYISGPVLAIIFSFAYPEFHTLRYDPMYITGFILANLTMVVIILGFTIPRYYERRGEGTEPTYAMETKGEVAGASVSDVVRTEDGEAPMVYASSQENEGKGPDDDKKATLVAR